MEYADNKPGITLNPMDWKDLKEMLDLEWFRVALIVAVQ